MKRFLFVTWEGGGNVPPELAIARKLVARGHQVRFLADPTIAADARAAGCAFSPWVTAPHRTTRDRSGDLIQDYAYKNPMTAIRKYMGQFLADPAPRGAGVRLKPTASATAIRGAVERVLHTRSYRDNAQKLAGSLRANEGCVDPVDLLEGLRPHDSVPAS
jgi:UDP:flavonoid glycosyltransferase YjiC (YdhE family)